METRYQYQRPGGEWCSLAVGETPDRRFHSGQLASVRVIDAPPKGKHLDLVYYLESASGQEQELHWRTTAAVGMDFWRFGQHCLQGMSYGFVMPWAIETAMVGGILLWLGVVYQRRESDDINDKGWWDIRGLGAGATIGASLGLAARLALTAFIPNFPLGFGND